MTTKTISTALGIGLMLAGLSVACGSPPDAKTPDLTGGAEAAPKDTDGDGIPDPMDKCPDQKEDGALPEPKDGCPNGVKPADKPKG